MWSVGIVVKKTTSVSGEDFLISLAIARSLVKCPNPTPFVGKRTTQSLCEFELVETTNLRSVSSLSSPFLSLIILKISLGNENGSFRMFIGFLTASVR